MVRGSGLWGDAERYPLWEILPTVARIMTNNTGTKQPWGHCETEGCLARVEQGNANSQWADTQSHCREMTPSHSAGITEAGKHRDSDSLAV